MKLTLFDNEILISGKKLILIIAIPVIAILLGTFGFIKLRENDKVFIGKSSNPVATTVAESASTSQPAIIEDKNEKALVFDEIKIYIVGCVKNEGIVTLKKGQIINDAVTLAGGLTKDADFQNINMAYILTENAMIKVKSKKEIHSESPITTKAQPRISPLVTGSGMEIEMSSGGAISNDITKEDKVAGKININTATLEELDTLPRIGEKTASDIITYREKVGGFKKVEDLMEVPRIGEKTFEDLKELIDIK